MLSLETESSGSSVPMFLIFAAVLGLGVAGLLASAVLGSLRASVRCRRVDDGF